jgi:hypothetical protein
MYAHAQNSSENSSAQGESKPGCRRVRHVEDRNTQDATSSAKHEASDLTVSAKHSFSVEGWVEVVERSRTLITREYQIRSKQGMYAKRATAHLASGACVLEAKYSAWIQIKAII